MTRTIRFALLLAVVGTSASALTGSNPENAGKELTYFQDTRTDLCFASMKTTRFGAVSITQVPCTEKVLAVIAR